MLATAAAKQLLATAKFRAGHIGRATYQTYSPHGRGIPGDGKWPSRLLAYLRNAYSSASAQMSRHVLTGNGLSNTAAGRLREAMPRGLGWASRVVPRTSCAAKSAMSRLGAHSYVRSISQRLAAQLKVWPGASRFAGSHMGSKHWAFGSGGKWSPYLKIFARSMSGPFMTNNASSARVIMAQIQRQTMVGLMTQQRREFSMVSPLAYETRIRFLAPEPAFATDCSSRRSTAGARVSSACKKEVPATASKNPSEGALPLRRRDINVMHPAAKTAQAHASLADQCVTITVPYSAPAKNQPLSEHGASPSDVFKLLADADKLQHQHRLLLSRLIERLSATGWDIYYQHVNNPAEGIEIALSPSSGICTVVELESLLCNWGFDTSHFAATLRDPRVLPAVSPVSDAPLSAAPISLALDSDRSWNSGSMDSNLFSLIIDEVVDPEEAYREDVCEFLNQLDRMPRLSSMCVKPGRL
ncbi:hypothetical protein GGH94_003088 [Coemansia aciculifera]|uniref:Uncharacterized protein n=1 Tax=Coemansia aciculifera TaxID=417176 RepID=A0A9W8IK18_9FUNG|nr:hypothetical protein GGH94_003088 [Coemansia aciculifera]